VLETASFESGWNAGSRDLFGQFTEFCSVYRRAHGAIFTNDKYPPATTESGELQTHADWNVEKTLMKRGSVVTKNLPAGEIVAGNPVKICSRHQTTKTPR